MSEVLTNEQKYKTAEERVKAFHDYCRSHKNGCEYCQLKQFQADETCVCFAYWLPLEAEEKPEPCPFCNGETEIVSCNGGIQVRCTHCGYTSEGYREGKENEAIAAHNRVARAVEAVKKGEVK